MAVTDRTDPWAMAATARPEPASHSLMRREKNFRVAKRYLLVDVDAWTHARVNFDIDDTLSRTVVLTTRLTNRGTLMPPATAITCLP